MQTNRLFASAVLCLVFSFSIQGQIVKSKPASTQHLQKQYTLFGHINGINNETVYLANRDGETERMDSTRAKNGRFIFKGKIVEPAFYILKFAGTRNQFGFFLGSGKTTIHGNKDSLSFAKITGNQANDEWKEWGKAWRNITIQAGPMYHRLDSVTQKGKVPASAEDRKVFDDGMKSLNDQTNLAVISFIHKHPQSPVGAFIIIDRFIDFPNPEMTKKTFAMLGDQAKKSLYGKKISDYRRIAAKTGVGAKPDFAVADTSGKKLKLSTLRGKYVLVDFWASWCAPCRKENPNVVKAYRQYHDKGFDIVGFSLDTKKNAWLKAIDMDSLQWNHVSDLGGWNSQLVKDYGIKVVPTNFLLDKNGVVIANNLRGEELQNKLNSLFK